jgi:hypothetical protein
VAAPVPPPPPPLPPPPTPPQAPANHAQSPAEKGRPTPPRPEVGGTRLRRARRGRDAQHQDPAQPPGAKRRRRGDGRTAGATSTRARVARDRWSAREKPLVSLCASSGGAVAPAVVHLLRALRPHATGESSPAADLERESKSGERPRGQGDQETRGQGDGQIGYSPPSLVPVSLSPCLPSRHHHTRVPMSGDFS